MISSSGSVLERWAEFREDGIDRIREGTRIDSEAMNLLLEEAADRGSPHRRAALDLVQWKRMSVESTLEERIDWENRLADIALDRFEDDALREQALLCACMRFSSLEPPLELSTARRLLPLLESEEPPGVRSRVLSVVRSAELDRTDRDRLAALHDVESDPEIQKSLLRLAVNITERLDGKEAAEEYRRLRTR